MDRGDLVGRFVVGECFFELMLPNRVGGIDDPRLRLSFRLDFEQVDSEVLHGLLNLFFAAFPEESADFG